MYEKLRDKNVNIDKNVETVASNSDKVNDDTDRELEFKDGSTNQEESSSSTTNVTDKSGPDLNRNVGEVEDNSGEKVPLPLKTTRKLTAPNVELEIIADKHDEASLHPDATPIPDDYM